MFKIAYAQGFLRRLHEKQAGWKLPVALGAGAVATAYGVPKAINKSREYKAGFNPGSSQ